MTRAQVQQWIAEGYHVLQGGQPKKVDGDLWDYLDALDEEDTTVLVLAELAAWTEEDLAAFDADNDVTGGCHA